MKAIGAAAKRPRRHGQNNNNNNKQSRSASTSRLPPHRVSLLVDAQITVCSTVFARTTLETTYRLGQDEVITAG